MRAIPILIAVAVVAGCAPAPKEREVRLARVAAEGRNMSEALDRLEGRLLASQSRVRFWRELRERHESISAVACASQEEHAEGMALHALPPQTSTLNRARVAAAAPAVTKAAVRSGAVR